MEIEPGTVYWFTGLAGAGKSTIGRLFYGRIFRQKPNVVFLDGDVLRVVFGDDLGHSIEDRRRSAMRNSSLCKLLSDQGIDVVCATISMFHVCHDWNRQNISRYREIYIRAPMKVLAERDQKQLYSRAGKGEIAQVMGLDLPFEEPLRPDLIIDNDGSKSPDKIIEEIDHLIIERRR